MKSADYATGDGFSTHTAFSYGQENTAQWLIGLPTRIAVTSSAPDAGSVTRTTDFAYNATTGALEKETREPLASADAGVRLMTTLTRAPTAAGQVTAVTRTPGVGTVQSYSLSYDADQTFLVTSTDPTGLPSSYAYVKALGAVKATQQGNGPILYTSVDYFGRRRRLGIQNLDGSQKSGAVNVSYRPAANGMTISESVEGGNSQTTTFDMLGRPSTATAQGRAGLTVSRSWEYDAAERPSADVDWHAATEVGGRAEYSYDALGRLTKQKNPDGSTSSFSYDQRRTTRTDELGRVFTREVDQAGLLLRSIERPNGVDVATTYEYGAFHDLRKITDPLGNPTTFEHDQLGQQTKRTDPDTGVTTTAYDSYGHPVLQTRADTKTTAYGYDATGRPTSERAPRMGRAPSPGALARVGRGS